MEGGEKEWERGRGERGRGLTYRQFVAWLQAFGADDDVHAGRVEDLSSIEKWVCQQWATPCAVSHDLLPQAQKRITDQRRLARVVDVQQVAVQVKVPVTAHLDRRVGGLGGDGARRELQLGEQAERREGNFGDALGGEGGLIDDDLLDVGVRRLRPVRLDGSHGVRD